MEASYVGIGFALVLSSMVLLTTAAPVQCSEPAIKVCSADYKQSCINERLLVRHLISEDRKAYDFNVTAIVHLGPYSTVEQGGKAYSGQQDPTKDTCTKQSFLARDGRLCRWDYTCDFDRHRLPPYIYRAQLIGTQNSKNKQMFDGSKGAFDCSCHEITAPVTVLQFRNCTNEEEEWTLKRVPVAIGYTCQPLLRR